MAGGNETLARRVAASQITLIFEQAAPGVGKVRFKKLFMPLCINRDEMTCIYHLAQKVHG